MTLLERRRALMSQNKEPYVFVEYIQSTGQEWIDTGIIANGNTKVDIDFQLTEISPSFVFGSRASSGDKMYTFNISSNGNFITGYDATNSEVDVADTKRHIAMKNHRTLYFDGNFKLQVSKSDFTTPANLEIFATYNNGTKGYLPSKIKLYSCDIYDGVTEGIRTQLRSFKPCYRKADRVAGLYDLISGEFFENQGTGNFLLGGEI